MIDNPLLFPSLKNFRQSRSDQRLAIIARWGISKTLGIWEWGCPKRRDAHIIYELSSIVRLERLTTEDSSSRQIMRFVPVFRGLKHRQRNAQQRRSQSKEDWVKGFVLGEKNNIYAVCCFEETTTFGSLTSCSCYCFQRRRKSASNCSQ